MMLHSKTLLMKTQNKDIWIHAYSNSSGGFGMYMSTEKYSTGTYEVIFKNVVRSGSNLQASFSPNGTNPYIFITPDTLTEGTIYTTKLIFDNAFLWLVSNSGFSCDYCVRKAKPKLCAWDFSGWSSLTPVVYTESARPKSRDRVFDKNKNPVRAGTRGELYCGTYDKTTQTLTVYGEMDGTFDGLGRLPLQDIY